jgi:hypothetical protein
MMFLEGYIGAPPTVTAISAARVGSAMAETAMAAAATDNAKVESFMVILL